MFQLWDEQVDGALAEELSEQQDSNRCGEWGCIWLVTGHQWCSSGRNSRAGSVQQFYQ